MIADGILPAISPVGLASHYPSWTIDGKQILFTTRPHEVWDLVAINADGTNFHVLKPGAQNEVTRYSPIWARDGLSVFCEDMANVYQLGLDGAVRAQWNIGKDRAERRHERRRPD